MTTILTEAKHGTVLDASGRPVPGATVTVYDSGTSNLSTIYTQSTASEPAPGQSNPITADANGFWAFSAPENYYDIVISGVGITTQYLYRVALVELR